MSTVDLLDVSLILKRDGKLSTMNTTDFTKSLHRHEISEKEKIQCFPYKSPKDSDLIPDNDNDPHLESTLQAFNASPKQCYEHLSSLGISPQRTAFYLRNTKDISQKKIGELLGEPGSTALQVLKYYARVFDFAEVPFHIALRMFLGRFQLPGESQQIDRILEAFSQSFYEQNIKNHRFKSAEAIHFLSFSALLLHTSVHNANVIDRNFMSKEQFVRTHIDTNTDKNSAYVESINELYDSILFKSFQTINRKPSELGDSEVEICFNLGKIGLELETAYDGITCVVKKYTNQDNVLWCTRKIIDFDGWVLIGINEDSSIGHGFPMTMWLLKVATRPITIRLCEPNCYFRKTSL